MSRRECTKGIAVQWVLLLKDSVNGDIKVFKEIQLTNLKVMYVNVVRASTYLRTIMNYRKS